MCNKIKKYQDVIEDLITLKEAEYLEEWNELFKNFSEQEVEKIMPITYFYFKMGFSTGMEFSTFLNN